MLTFVGLIAGAIAFSFGQRRETAISRIKDFINPQEIPFQAKQSYIAIASGGITGRGPGHSIRRNQLPHSYSDFIFAIIVEEYGLAGGGMVVLLYLVLLFRAVNIVTRAPGTFGSFLTIGVAFSLVFQAMINMGVAVNLLPVTGQTLPLISMGGTSIWFTSLAIGIILSVSKELDKRDREQVNEAIEIANA
jgi:cell division protein FtsW